MQPLNDASIFMPHSCDPTLWYVSGDYNAMTARRDIYPGIKTICYLNVCHLVNCKFFVMLMIYIFFSTFPY